MNKRQALFVASAFTAMLYASNICAQSADADVSAQNVVTHGDTFTFEIGHAAHASSSYSILSTQPVTSKLTGQKIRLKAVDSDPAGTTTRYFTLATGKHRTVAQLDAFLVEIFRRFLASPPPLANQKIGDLGDIRYGGEVLFLAQSSDVLRFDNLTPGQPPRSSFYSRADIETFLTILAGAPQS